MMKLLMTVRGHAVQLLDDGSISFVSGMTIDADGSPRAYGPDGKGLDYLANAGHPGNWWGLSVNFITDKPNIQGGFVGDSIKIKVPAFSDETKGYFVSTTAYQRKQFLPSDFHRYLNSETENFIVVPAPLRMLVKGIVLGCRATVTDLLTNQTIEAVVGDIGPATHLGEASIAVAKAFGINSDPKHGGIEDPRFRYKLWPGVAATGYELQAA